MKAVILGSAGQLGKSLLFTGKDKKGIEIIPLGHREANIANESSIREALSSVAPDVVINCAAFSNVDQCEERREYSFHVNASGNENVSKVCEDLGCALYYISTDYVFDGKKQAPYLEGDAPSPLQVYGETKLEGERLAAESCSRLSILRISWLYGPYGVNFLKTILNKATKTSLLRVVDDQIGSPTNSLELSEAIWKLVENGLCGTYHLTGNEPCSRYSFASSIVRLYGMDCVVESCKTEDYPTVAKRPPYSYLDNSHFRDIFENDFLPWEESLERFRRDYPLSALQ